MSEKQYKFITKNCKGCNIEINYKIYIDATDAEMAELDNFCQLCRLKLSDPNRIPYVCAYCGHNLFTMVKILDAQTYQSFVDVRCAKCQYNQQRTVRPS